MNVLCYCLIEMSNHLCIGDEASEILLHTVADNCNAVEKMALETIISRHIPLLNTMLCLSKEDCRDILEKYNSSQNVIEQTVLLIALTDFISCACANSGEFPMKSRKNEGMRSEGKRSGMKSLLQLLQNSWHKLFSKLSEEDMSANQLCSVINLTKSCLERIPDESYKIFVERVVKMAEKVLNKLHKPLKYSNMSIEEGKLANEVEQSVASVKEKTMIADIITQENKNENKGNKRKVKGSSDIMKFILKSCENTVKPKQEEQIDRSTQVKRKFEEINQMDANLGTDSSTIDNVPIVELQYPPCKKPCLDDDFVNGKVNAFKMLMKSRSAGKRPPNTCIISA